MKGIRFSERSIPLFFLTLTVVAYGLLLPLTGFYWDDLPFAWIAEFLGPAEFLPAFAKVRPFLGPIFFVTTSLIPPVPLYWQIFALVIRFLSALAAWFAFRQVWPRHKWQTLIASLLFLVFPGYSQHWVAYTHINQEWIPFIFYLLSFGFSARALRKRYVAARKPEGLTNQSQPANNPETVSRPVSRDAASGATRPAVARTDTILALLLLIPGVFPTEYFVSIEPIRFLFIWVIVAEQVEGFRQRFMEALQRWLPYLLVWLANGAWLAYFYTLGGYASYDVEVVKKPLTALGLLSTIGEALWKAGIYVWVQVLALTSRALTAPTTLITFVLIFMAFVVLVFYLRKLDLTGSETRTFAVSAILIGLAGILLGRIPSFAAGLPLTLQSSYDRFMVSMMLGGCLFVTGSLELLVKNPRLKIYVFALLVALGIGQQFFNANIFRRDWTKQQEIYWQLAWRIPDMKPGTALLTDQMPIDYETDLSFTAPINWIYAPDYAGGNLPYALFYTEKRLGGGALPALEKNTEISLPIRRVSFRGSTSQALVIYMPPNGCLRVLDPVRGDAATYSRQSRFLVEAIPLSDLSNIVVDSDRTPQLPFLSEPEHEWCYYFAKAELARQREDWTQVTALIGEAEALGYRPADPFEWLTYIEALAMTGNIEEAAEVSQRAFRQEEGLRKGLCELWKRLQSAGGGADQILDGLRCAG